MSEAVHAAVTRQTVKTILIAIGGPTNSGKTLLAKHLIRALPEGDAFIIHQDDFAPPQELLPINPEHPELGEDWDFPPTAIDWAKFRQALAYSKAHGEVSPDVKSHDHLNAQEKVNISDDLIGNWKSRFAGLKAELEAQEENVRIVFALVDGFLLYWDAACTELYDVLFFLRVPRETLRQRRELRATYVTQTGDVWRDPPNYHPKIVWPAYVFGHSHLFENGDVENGALITEVASWEGRKSAEQVRGGWAEENLSKMRDSLGSTEDRKGKRKAGVETRGTVMPQDLLEFQPKEGSEGMEDMVSRALGKIFDAVQSMP